MADYSDGSIVVDSEINSEGFKAGSKELADAIKSLSKQVENLGGIIKSAFAGNMREVSSAASGISDVGENARSAESEVAGLNKEMSNIGTGHTAPEIDLGSAKTSINSTEREIGSLEKSLDRLGPVAQKAASGNGAAMGEFEAKADSAERSIERLEGKVNELSNTRFQTQDYTELANQIGAAEKKLFSLYERQDKMKATGVKETSRSWQSLQYDIQRAEETLERFERQKSSMIEDGKAFEMGSSLPQVQAMSASLASAKQQLAGMRSEMTGVASSGSLLQRVSNGLHGAIQGAGGAIREARDGFQNASKSASRLLEKVKSMGKSALRFAGNIAKASIGMRSFGRETTNANTLAGAMYKKFSNLGSMFKRKLLRTFISSIITGLKEGMQSLAQYSDSFNKTMSEMATSTSYLKNSFASAFAPILSAVVPILATLINWLATAITYINMFFAALRGATSVIRATKVQKDYAGALKDTAGAAGGAAKATERQLAAFDELNVLSDSSSGGGGGGGGAGAALDEFEEVPVESRIADFMNRIKKAFKDGDYEEVGRILGQGINYAFKKADDFINWDNIGGKVTKYVKIFCDIFNGMVDEIDWELIGKTFADGLNTIVNTVYLLVTGIDWTNLGKKFTEGLNSFVSNVNWKKLGQTVGVQMQAALNVLYEVVTNFDWKKLGSSIADSFNGLFQSIDWKKLGKTLGNAVIGALNTISSFLGTFDWEGLGRDIADFICGIDWFGLLKVIGVLIWNALKAAIEINIGLFKEIGSNISEGIKTGISEVWSNIKNWVKENIVDPFVQKIKDLFGIHSPSTVMAEIGHDIVDGLLKGIKEKWNNITKWLGNAVDEIKKTVVEKWDNIKKKTSTAWGNIKETVSTKLSDTKKKVVDIGSNIKKSASDTWSNVKKSVTDHLSKAKTNASSAWSSIKSTATTTGSNIKSAASSAWSSVRTHITDSLSKAKSNASSAWSSIKSTATTTGSNIKSSASSAWSSIKSYITSNLSSAKSSASSAWSSLKSTAVNSASNIKSNISSSFSNIRSTIANSISNARASVSSGMSTMKSNISGNLQSAMASVRNLSWSSVGSNIVSGIRNGLNSSWYWLNNTAATLASNLLRSVKNRLGIHSPSRVFEEEVGEMIPLGMANGVDNTASKVFEAVASVAEGAIEAAEQGDAVIDIGVASTDMVSNLDGVLQTFSSKVEKSFTQLAETLESISNRVAFAVPVVATGTMLPYNVAAKAEAGGNGGDVGDIIESTHEDMVSVVTQAVNNAVLAIVKAIEENGGSRESMSKDGFTQAVIDEINRRTRMSGKSPLLI